MEKKTWRWLFLGTGLLWVLMELLAVFDGNTNTEPLTTLIVENVPKSIGLTVILGFCVWLARHFIKKYEAKK